MNFQPTQVIIGPQQRQMLLNSIPRLTGKKVLIVGDVGIDEYYMGNVRRISPEAPVPILEVEREELRLGLAANISQNIASLGGKAITIGVIGADFGAQTLKDLFARAELEFNCLVIDEARPTTRKTRVMAQHHHLVRVDHEKISYLSKAIQQEVVRRVEEQLPNADIVILQDYGKGVVSSELVQILTQLCFSAKKRLLVDPHRSKNAEFYYGCDLLKPNYDEAISLSGLKFDELQENPDRVYLVGRALQKKSGAREVVLTRGKEGMTIFSEENITEVPTYAKKVFDVTGAGDTVIGTMALGLASGMDLVGASMLANFAAGVVVGKIGSAPCERQELKNYIELSATLAEE